MILQIGSENKLKCFTLAWMLSDISTKVCSETNCGLNTPTQFGLNTALRFSEDISSSTFKLMLQVLVCI